MIQRERQAHTTWQSSQLIQRLTIKRSLFSHYNFETGHDSFGGTRDVSGQAYTKSPITREKKTTYDKDFADRLFFDRFDSGSSECARHETRFSDSENERPGDQPGGFDQNG